MVRARCLTLAALVAITAASSRVRAVNRDQEQPLRDNRPFKSGVELISITATVTDAEGHLITGLPREAFQVFEDGEHQVVTQFTSERVPVGLGLLLDASDSMFGKRIKDARAAVDRFLFDLLAPTDQFFVFVFNHRPKPLTGWTRAQDEVQHALAAVQPSGGTAIFDAILESLPLIAIRTRERAAILVISDGADTASSASMRELRSALLRSDAFVYAIAIDPAERQAINADASVETLREVTADTGGRTEIVRTSDDLSDATARIAEEFNSQYVLGYSSSHKADGHYHSIRVRAGEYRVRARRGYVR